MYSKNTYHFILKSIYRNIEYYRNRVRLSSNPYQRMFFEILFYNERIRFNCLKSYYYHRVNTRENQLNKRIQSNKNVFTVEKLVQYDGSNGKPAYVAVNGIVYDVSLEATWGGGTHFGLYAGKDLTTQFNGCHGGKLEILKNLPKVGVLEK